MSIESLSTIDTSVDGAAAQSHAPASCGRTTRREFLRFSAGGFAASWAMFHASALAEVVAPRPPLPQQRQDGEQLRRRHDGHVPRRARILPRQARGRRRHRGRHGRHRQDRRAHARGPDVAGGLPRLQGTRRRARGAGVRLRQPRPPRVEVAPAGRGRERRGEGGRREEGRDRSDPGRGGSAGTGSPSIP